MNAKGIIYMTPALRINPTPYVQKSMIVCKWARTAGKPPVRQTNSGFERMTPVVGASVSPWLLNLWERRPCAHNLKCFELSSFDFDLTPRKRRC